MQFGGWSWRTLHETYISHDICRHVFMVTSIPEDFHSDLYATFNGVSWCILCDMRDCSQDVSAASSTRWRQDQYMFIFPMAEFVFCTTSCQSPVIDGSDIRQTEAMLIDLSSPAKTLPMVETAALEVRRASIEGKSTATSENSPLS
jgi:hypothetical protein